MHRKIFLFFFLMVSGVLISQKCNASHGMGGEITWTCTPTGEFIFEMKFYRDCNGIPGPANVILATTVPGVSNITLTLFSQNDISPDGLHSNGFTPCPTCAQGGTPPTPGIVEEFIYRSSPINLPGVPPATGWVFSWGTCCRSNVLTNVTSGGSVGFQNRAIMYPYQGTNNLPCFDSSPYFAEEPSMVICTGYPFKYNPNAIDPESDSLVYSWGELKDDFGVVIPFAPGYNINSQLPSPVQNPLNVAATIHPNTGEIAFTSFTGGYFATVVKVTTYKCGIKVAEIFREIDIVLLTNCPPVSGGPNLPPSMSAPFLDPNTGLMTSYVDTVSAGTVVNFVLNVTDFDLFTNNTPQQITLEGSGSQFGLNFTDPDSGCTIPPCATFTSSLPTTFMIAGTIGFNWETTCDHVTGINAQCVSASSTYNFVLKAHDNYCPANATTLATISITVTGESPVMTVTGPASICQGDTVVLTASGAQSYVWSTGETGDTITVTAPGTYSVTGITPGVCSGSTEIIIPPGTISNVIASAPNNAVCINWPADTLLGTPAGGVWSGPGITGNLFNPAIAGAGGHYLIYTLTDSVGCIGIDTLFMTVLLCTGLEESDNNTGVFVYPNPAVDQINLVLSGKQSQETKIELYNVYGQKVMDIFDGKIEQSNWERTIDISKLNEGIYIIRINGKSSQNSVFVK